MQKESFEKLVLERTGFPLAAIPFGRQADLLRGGVVCRSEQVLVVWVGPNPAADEDYSPVASDWRIVSR